MSSLPAAPSGDDPHNSRAVAHSTLDAVSNKVRAPVSDKARSPRRGNGETGFERVARLATRARGKGSNDRKRLDFPSLRRVYAKQRTNPATGEVTKGRSYYRDIWDYCQEWAYRILNDLQGMEAPPPERGQLRDLFEARIRERALIWHEYDGRSPGLESAIVDALVDNAAEAALRDWSEQWIAGRRKAGQAGGRISKRVSTWTAEDLDVLALFQYLRPSDRLRVFNSGRAQPYSRATVYRMLDALRERHAPEPPPELRQPTRREEAAADRRERAEVDAGLWEARRAYESEQIERRLAAEQEHAERLARFERYART